MQYYDDIIKFAKSLHYLKIKEKKALNIMGWNAPEWIIAWHGGMFNNNIVTGVYTTNSPTACVYQAQHSEAQAIIVDTQERLERYLSIIDEL